MDVIVDYMSSGLTFEILNFNTFWGYSYKIVFAKFHEKQKKSYDRNYPGIGGNVFYRMLY